MLENQSPQPEQYTCNITMVLNTQSMGKSALSAYDITMHIKIHAGSLEKFFKILRKKK